MLNYQTYGPDTLPPLLITHGLFGSGRNWGALAKKFSDIRHVVTVDMRNHGRSFRSAEHTYDALAQDLAEVIETFGGTADVIGHSMGGKSVMTLALRQPDMVRRLVVADIAPVSYAHDQLRYIDAMRAVDMSAVSRRSDAQQQLAALGVEPKLTAFFTQSLDVASQSWLYNLDALADQMPEIMSFPTHDLLAFQNPTLFLTGALSDYVTHAHRPQIKSLFPQARFAKLNGAGHWLHAEKPQAFEDVVRAFLEA